MQNTYSSSQAEEKGVGLIQSWLWNSYKLVEDLGVHATANIQRLFEELNDSTEDWLSSLPLEDTKSLFLISLRLMGNAPQSSENSTTKENQLLITTLSKDFRKRDNKAVLYVSGKVGEENVEGQVWTALTKSGAEFSIQRTIMALFTWKFIGDFQYTYRSYGHELDRVSSKVSYDQDTRSEIMKTWNSIQRSRNEWSIYQI